MVRSAPLPEMPMKAGAAASPQSIASPAGTAIAAVRSWVVLNGIDRAMPPVRVSTRRPPRNGTSVITSASPLSNGLSWLIRNASTA